VGDTEVLLEKVCGRRKAAGVTERGHGHRQKRGLSPARRKTEVIGRRSHVPSGSP
jgi:hypothetical protein